ncbi:restriction endonuclease subunit S [Photobacterium damselae]|uniref:restriction endonuclease subunit S n=1 Tax=Photobacterium damselae TaxID=38293 RepID=UPI00370C8953
MVPNGWAFTTFENHIDLLSGFAFKSAQYTENSDDIRLLRGDNIAPNTLRWDGVKTWDKHQYAELQKYHLRENDFVIAMDRTWVSSGLKVAEVTKNDLPCLLVQRVARIRSLPTLEQSLLRQYFSSHRFEQYVKGVQTETAVPHISSKQIKEFPLLLPPLPEQRKIAQILSTWDRGIATTEKLIDASKQQKKALMQQLLTGKKRLVDPETGKAFEGEWEEVNIASRFELITDYVASGSFASLKENVIVQDIESYAHYVRQTDLAAKFNNKNLKWVDKDSYDFLKKSNLFEGDILFTNIGDLGKVFYMPKLTKPATVAPNLVVLRTNQSNDSRFIYYTLASDVGQREIDKIKSGTGLPKINKTELKTMKFRIPQLEEQQKIASVLTTADKEIELLEAKLAHFKQEKKALMQQLLTGKRRVNIAETKVATEETLEAEVA